MFHHIDTGFKPLKMQVAYEGSKRFYIDDDGVPYISITSLLQDFKGKKEVLAKWRKRVGEKAADKESKRAIQRGDNIHAMIERYLKNENPKDFIYTPASKILFNQARPILDRRLNNIHVQEVQVFSKILKIAGRLDTVAEWDGKLSVVDFKGSKKEKKEEWIHDYKLQSAFYSLAYWEMTGILPKQTVILIIAEDYSTKAYIDNPAKWIDMLKDEVKRYRKTQKAIA